MVAVCGSAATNPAITQATVTDPSTGSALVTDGPVNVSIVGDPGAAATAGYAITEDEFEPTSWSGTAPTSYTIAGDGDIKLYAWVKDANEVVVSQPMAGYILKNASLKHGWNELLLRTLQTAGDWRFKIELVDCEGLGPPAGVETRAMPPDLGRP